MTIKIELKEDEALVLFDLIETLKSYARHLALDRVDTYSLDQLQASIGTVLDEAHSPNYPELVAQARKAVRSELAD